MAERPCPKACPAKCCFAGYSETITNNSLILTTRMISNILIHTRQYKFHFFTFSLFLIFFMGSCGTSSGIKKLSPEELQEDFQTITKHIEKDVPDPYYSCPKSAYDSVKNKIYTELDDSMTSIQFYRTVYPLIRILNDAHFSMKPDNKLLKRSEVDSLLFLPFKVMIQDDQLFVLENHTKDTTIKEGDEIVSINGQPVKNIIEKLRSCNFKSAGEENFFERRYGTTFYKWLFVLWGYKGDFSVKFLHKGTVTVQGVPEKDVFDSSYPKDRKFYSFEILSDQPYKTGYIKITTLKWDKPSRRDSLDNFLKETFKTIKKDSVKNLIIDIRNNGGGSSVLAKDIFDYITDNPLRTSLGEDYFNKGKLVRYMVTSWYKPKKISNKFSGKTVLLTNVMTYSSAHIMAVAFQYYHLGITVGQVSAEPLYITGEVKKIALPNSGCIFYCPSTNFLLPGYQENKKAYLVPDYRVYPGLKDILNKKDTMLNLAVKLFDKP